MLNYEPGKFYVKSLVEGIKFFSKNKTTKQREYGCKR